MSNIFSRLFNSGKHDTTYTGTKPVTSLEQVGLGSEYKQNILDRLNRRNLGYGEKYTGYSAPQVENLRNTFNSYTLPELNSYLTKQGRSGGSAGFSQIEQAFRNEALNENDIVGRLAQRNAEAEREDYNNAMNSAGNYAQNEADLIAKRSAFDYGDQTRQVTEANQRRANEAKGLQKTGEMAVRLAAMPFTGGASATGFGFDDLHEGSSPGTYYKPSAPPANYDYSNINKARLAARRGQKGRI